MPNPTEISLLNYNFEAKACNELLTAMLNHSDFDYVTVDELRRYSELSQFTLSRFQSETIAFTPTKNAPSEITEGALYQNWSL